MIARPGWGTGLPSSSTTCMTGCRLNGVPLCAVGLGCTVDLQLARRSRLCHGRKDHRIASAGLNAGRERILQRRADLPRVQLVT